jgi:hypothetical protein
MATPALQTRKSLGFASWQKSKAQEGLGLSTTR